MKCDIVIPVWNQPSFTKDCVDSILKNTTDIDYRLIIIDNASDEETKKYLEGLRDIKGLQIFLVRNNNNLGFVKASNQGMRLCEAPYICLINNDTVVTEGWLSEMIRIADTSPEIGLVNPSSNNLGQRPSKGESVEMFAQRLKEESGKFFELGSAIGFCMLIKKEVIKKIGLFDEIYGMGNFEDTDFSRRAVKEGYICVRACGAYVYHREHGSFGDGRAFDDNFERNRQIYEFRWGKRRWISYILDSADEYALARFNKDAMKLARNGYWVWLFSRNRLEVPRHSNIIVAEIPKNFYAGVLFKILFKKKRFNEIYVTEERFAKILERLSFIHKAKVYYY